MRIKIKNKKRFGIVLSIVLVLIAMISGTYSLFYRENVASNAESYSTGILNIVAKSKSDNINLTNALPMSDEEGVLTEPYVFTIENIGNLDYNFKIRLLSTSDNPINPDYIKLKIDDGEVTTLSSLTNSVIKDNITLKAKEVMDVSIRIWLASNTPNTQIGKSFNSKIVTEGQAVYTQMNNEDGTLSNSDHEPFRNLVEHITKLYYDNKDTIVSDYQYSSSVNLMNDRLGKTTEDLDGGNIRYYGLSPKNYIDIGDRSSNNGVILWRIIGVFDGNVRIVRNNSIGSYSWDTSASTINQGYGINEWSQADLMKLLNPGYETNTDFDSDGTTRITVNNSLWWNSGTGKCYNGLSYANTDCDFSSSGLSEQAKKYVTDQTIYLGHGTDTTARSSYRTERGTSVFDSTNSCYGQSHCNDTVERTLTWTGKVGLLYPSDYGYAADFSKGRCNDTIYMENYYGECNSDWLKGIYEVFVSPDSGLANSVWKVNSSGNVSTPGFNVYCATGVRPVLTLSSEVKIESEGDGTSTNPYVLN